MRTAVKGFAKAVAFIGDGKMGQEVAVLEQRCCKERGWGEMEQGF